MNKQTQNYPSLLPVIQSDGKIKWYRVTDIDTTTELKGEDGED